MLYRVGLDVTHEELKLDAALGLVSGNLAAAVAAHANRTSLVFRMSPTCWMRPGASGTSSGDVNHAATRLESRWRPVPNVDRGGMH